MRLLESCASGLLRGVKCLEFTDVSGRILGPIICVLEEYLLQVVRFCRTLLIGLLV